MRDRIISRLSSLRSRGERALALFVTACFPRLEATVDIALALEEGGADLLELGMPFSDPLADGPVIQRSSMTALANGMSLHVLLDQLAELRRRSTLPVVLMGYVNPILRFGPERFFTEAAARGADGIILPEVPLEELGRFGEFYESSGLARILLVAPTSDERRIAELDRASSGFLYCVSMTGVTGREVGDSPDEHVRRVKRLSTANSVLVGFGISSPEAARRFASLADGVIVGSSLLRRLASATSLREITGWVSEFKHAISAA